MTNNRSLRRSLVGIGLSLVVGAGACTASDPIFRSGEGGMTGIGGQVDPGLGGTPGAGGQPYFATGGQAGSGTGGQPDFGTGGQPFFATGGQAGSGAGGQPDFGTGGQPYPGIGGQAGSGTGGATGSCDQVVTLADCEARFDCYAVFFDPGTCGCAASGCCAHFHHCSDGSAATCAGQVSCAVTAPHCESPYLVSFRNGCYEGCVHNKDCAP